MQMKPGEKVADFCDRFDAMVKLFNESEPPAPLSDHDKASAFFGATKEHCAEMRQSNMMQKANTKVGLTVEEMKSYLLQAEAIGRDRANRVEAPRAARVAEVMANRCYRCNEDGHLAPDCELTRQGKRFAPLVTTKDAPLPTISDYASGSCEEKWTRIEGLVSGLANFMEPKGNLPKEIGRYTACLVQAISAFKKTKKSIGLAPPSFADKSVCMFPKFSVVATSKRPAMSPLATRATSKRYAATAASRQIHENNNDAVDQDQDGFVLVDHRRHCHRNQPATVEATASIG
ncbi:hypothetical protein TKK_0008137 [Trichogramma kaykai]